MRLRELLNDQPMSLPEAASYLGRITGRKPHVSTLFRWCLKGCGGVRLESVHIGRLRFVTASALDRFVAESTQKEPSAATPAPTHSVPPAPSLSARVRRHNEQRRAEVEAARRRLDELTGVAKSHGVPPVNRSA